VSTGFSATLWSATRAEREEATRAGCFTPPTVAARGSTAYAMLLGQLLPIYDVLDRAARARRDHPVVGPLMIDPLPSPSALEAELRTLLGPDWPDACVPVPAGRVYLDRLREVVFTWPGGLVAHRYMRSLGELPAPRLAAYRDRLDVPAWDEAEQRRIVEECRRALRLQRDLFCAVGSARAVHLVA